MKLRVKMSPFPNQTKNLKRCHRNPQAYPMTQLTHRETNPKGTSAMLTNCFWSPANRSGLEM